LAELSCHLDWPIPLIYTCIINLQGLRIFLTLNSPSQHPKRLVNL
jgi:hypothetical protein